MSTYDNKKIHVEVNFIHLWFCILNNLGEFFKNKCESLCLCIAKGKKFTLIFCNRLIWLFFVIDTWSDYLNTLFALTFCSMDEKAPFWHVEAHAESVSFTLYNLDDFSEKTFIVNQSSQSPVAADREFRGCCCVCGYVYLRSQKSCHSWEICSTSI